MKSLRGIIFYINSLQFHIIETIFRFRASQKGIDLKMVIIIFLTLSGT